MRHLMRAFQDRAGLVGKNRALEAHLAAAGEWILRAQKATPDHGVAHSYDLKLRKWLASYPETTGYIIPTLYDYARHFGVPAYAKAAYLMAQWEVSVQLPDGGVRAGTMDAEIIAPTIFNTGQVLFGLARAATESGDEQLREALKRAADWLVAAQDADGAWRRFGSPFTSTKMATYNTRSAFGLVRAFEVIQDPEYLEAAQRNVSFALSTAHDNGWLPGNDLSHNLKEKALTHTLAYSIRGILEVGVAVGKQQYIDAALKMAKALAASQDDNGALAGYYDLDWKPTSRWSCITGNAQMAINWFRLAKLADEPALRDNARAANKFNMAMQDLDSPDPGVRGGIKGSHPIDGDYMRWRYPNWAAKFFMDALMLEALYPDVDNVG
jgi:hypothetical protein